MRAQDRSGMSITYIGNCCPFLENKSGICIYIYFIFVKPLNNCVASGDVFTFGFNRLHYFLSSGWPVLTTCYKTMPRCKRT